MAPGQRQRLPCSPGGEPALTFSGPAGLRQGQVLWLWPQAPGPSAEGSHHAGLCARGQAGLAGGLWLGAGVGAGVHQRPGTCPGPWHVPSICCVSRLLRLAAHPVPSPEAGGLGTRRAPPRRWLTGTASALPAVCCPGTCAPAPPADPLPSEPLCPGRGCPGEGAVVQPGLPRCRRALGAAPAGAWLILTQGPSVPTWKPRRLPSRTCQGLRGDLLGPRDKDQPFCLSGLEGL